MTFYLLAFVPGLVTVAVVMFLMAEYGASLTLSGALFGALAGTALPWFSIWFVREVLGDHTANIGAVLMVFAQPLLAPVGAGLGAMLGGMLSAMLRNRSDRRNNGDDTLEQ